MNRSKNSEQVTTTTSSQQQQQQQQQRSDFNVIKSLKEFNRSQINKILSIDNDTALDHDVGGTTHESDDVPQLTEPAGVAKTLKKFPIYYEWVQTLMDYNEELMEIIDKINLNSETKATHDNYDSMKLIDFDVNKYEPAQQTATLAPSSSPIENEEISEQNQKLIAENADLKRQITHLELQKEGLEEAALEARVLVFEVAERHDTIVKLKNEINDMEQQLKQKDTHIQFKDEIIKELRQQRRGYSRCPHNLGKTKLDSIDKVVDLIRTVSRDISPESSKYCDCYNEFYQEKENQTDDAMCQSFEMSHEYARKIESQQAEIELLNAELDKKESSYDKISKAYASLQQQLESVKSINAKSNNGSDFQVGKTVKSTAESASVEDFSTAIADKTHLANLITTLKSELASANALLKIKEKDYHEAKDQLKQSKGDLSDANKRVSMFEKQCENYRQTIEHLEDHLKTHSDTIKRLEEHQDILKTQVAESQEKQQNIQKLMEENRKLDSNTNFLNVHSSSPPATASTCSNNVSSSASNCSCHRYPRETRETSADIISENLQTSFQENLKLNKVITLLRDEILSLRERIIDVETDYVTLNDSYRHFITITFQYENDLLEELAFKSYDYDEDSLSNGTTNVVQPPVVNGIQEKLNRMENDYAKRMKIQEICYKKKLSELQRNIMDLNRRMEAPDAEANKSEGEETPRSTLKELVAQIHHLQQEVREKEMLIKRNEISMNFKNDSLNQKVVRLEKLVEQEKLLNTNLTAEVDVCRKESRRLKESSLSTSNDQLKQLNDLKRQNGEHVVRFAKQHDEIQRLNAKLKDATLINTQLNDELNEKTEQICQLHGENSRMSIEMTKLVSEIKNDQETASHMSLQLATERKTTDSTSKSLVKCEEQLKMFTDKSQQLSRENNTLTDNVVELKEHLTESQRREDVLSQEIKSLTDLLKDAQHNLKISNESVHRLSIYQHKFVDLKKAHDQLLEEIAEKAANIKSTEVNLTKLQNSYDLLLSDFNDLKEIKGKAEHTLKTANEWQHEQQRREELINKKIAMQSEHISTLLDDRNALIAKNHEMLRDIFILKEKLQDFNCYLPNAQFTDVTSSFSLSRPILRFRSDPQINDFEDYQQRLDYSVKRMTTNLQRTRAFWENGISDAIQNRPKPVDTMIDDDSITESPRVDDTLL
ncbi:uncharacterized protein LOC129568714 isoform X2 [Sitodiplosis mosellana]|uniref:uncharacterized protein LOC129568714 isoform X2 n=1 Tax=Sitodiplosis mosellana TaxID=263140 RepID=UPI002445106E|nr:uncharacterized protein LOC129568714 isoform X2 [Sitodiplosis mosellana]